jgi:glyoxylase-like metal-dependent hydrolase (beta-lactamase superfamily II)
VNPLLPNTLDCIEPTPPQPPQGAWKPPKAVFDSIYAFAPNRDTLGGTAYLIVEKFGNVLIDCPPWHEVNQEFINNCGGVRWLVITHRDAIAKADLIQKALECEVTIQEQEAYLLPGLNVVSFAKERFLHEDLQLISTPGHSPGSACLYYRRNSGILFTGRHLLPNSDGELALLRTAKTFHWPRQIKSAHLLLKAFNSQALNYICPGGNIGFLRGQLSIDRAYERLSNLLSVENS